ncbi:hypothetical protein GZH46_02054, partial [Fragariocoptes setiger]
MLYYTSMRFMMSRGYSTYGRSASDPVNQLASAVYAQPNSVDLYSTSTTTMPQFTALTSNQPSTLSVYPADMYNAPVIYTNGLSTNPRLTGQLDRRAGVLLKFASTEDQIKLRRLLQQRPQEMFKSQSNNWQPEQFTTYSQPIDQQQWKIMSQLKPARDSSQSKVSQFNSAPSSLAEPSPVRPTHRPEVGDATQLRLQQFRYQLVTARPSNEVVQGTQNVHKDVQNVQERTNFNNNQRLQQHQQQQQRQQQHGETLSRDNIMTMLPTTSTLAPQSSWQQDNIDGSFSNVAEPVVSENDEQHLAAASSQKQQPQQSQSQTSDSSSQVNNNNIADNRPTEPINSESIDSSSYAAHHTITTDGNMLTEQQQQQQSARPSSVYSFNQMMTPTAPSNDANDDAKLDSKLYSTSMTSKITRDGDKITISV